MGIKDFVLLRVNNDDIGENGEFTVPEGVTEIGAWAFYDCSSLMRVVIPEGVTSIGCAAFGGCENLTSVVIPAGVESIENEVFRACESLTSITIPEGVTEIGEGAFWGCKRLKIVIISDSVKSIGTEAFRDCEKLTNITIPDSVTKIGYEVFCGCESLTSITIPEGVTEIGPQAFWGCVQLKSKPANYKAFQIKDGELYCLKKKYKEGVKHFVRGELELFKNGIHYCTNLFEVFNFYGGELDKDIAIYEIEVGDKVLTSDSSKCCTNSCRLKKRLFREDIIKILNEKAV